MKVLNLDLNEHSYKIFIEKGILDTIGIRIKEFTETNKIVVITDSNVDALYSKAFIENLSSSGYDVSKIAIKPGEESKSFETLISIYDKLLDLKINRSSTIIALGGGIVGDVVGFAASTFLRGVSFIQVPTTLLAQVDSSIGGKVAVNHPRGKNLIGSFYHPKAVFIDPNVLDTLNPRFFYDGMAEVIKYGCIRDKDLFFKLLNFENLEALKDNLEDIIYRCCSIKKAVVENDEKDTGERMILNFGHTIGHAIEKYFNFETYTHGEAVAVGMKLITEISEKKGLTPKGTTALIEQIIKKYNLPLEIPSMDTEKILETIKLDKKNLNGGLNVILLKEIGECFINKIEDKAVISFFQ